MGKLFKKVEKFADDHSTEILMGTWGIAGALLGYLFSFPEVSTAVGNTAKKAAKAVTSNIHVTFGNDRNSVRIDTDAGAKERPAMNYWELQDRREAREHEERMAEMKMRMAPIDGEGTVK